MCGENGNYGQDPHRALISPIVDLKEPVWITMRAAGRLLEDCQWVMGAQDPGRGGGETAIPSFLVPERQLAGGLPVTIETHPQSSALVLGLGKEGEPCQQRSGELRGAERVSRRQRHWGQERLRPTILRINVVWAPSNPPNLLLSLFSLSEFMVNLPGKGNSLLLEQQNA